MNPKKMVKHKPKGSKHKFDLKLNYFSRITKNIFLYYDQIQYSNLKSYQMRVELLYRCPQRRRDFFPM